MFSSLLSLWASVWMQPMLMLLRYTETRVHHSPGARLILNWFSNYLLLIVAIAEKRLMDVKLGELGSWFGARDFTPNGIISAVRRGEDTRLQYSTNLCSILIFQYECVLSPPTPTPTPGHDRYYNKYINVKKGGIGGVAMLLVGYVAMSYLWEYDHISMTLPSTSPFAIFSFLLPKTDESCLPSSRTRSLEEVPLTSTIRPSGMDHSAPPTLCFLSLLCSICDRCDQ